MGGLTVGRVVHYVVSPGEHRAATITDVLDKEAGIVSLHVFWLARDNKTGSQFDKGIEMANYAPPTRNEPGSWHWIERA